MKLEWSFEFVKEIIGIFEEINNNEDMVMCYDSAKVYNENIFKNLLKKKPFYNIILFI